MFEDNERGGVAFMRANDDARITRNRGRIMEVESMELDADNDFQEVEAPVLRVESADFEGGEGA